MSKTSKEIADNIRKHIIDKVYSLGNKGAHVAPALSLADILSVLFNEFLLLKRADFEKMSRPRFILSKGHGALAYYSTLYETGVISKEEFDTFEVNGGNYPGQPSKNLAAAIEYSGGSLGLGLSYASGLALSKNSKENKIYVIMGDGELNEGSVWESAMFVGHNKLKNITAIIDYNKMQSDGSSAEILTFDIRKMFEACNWDIVECDGHNVESIRAALSKETDCPKVIIARTIKGKGVSFMENSKEWHHNYITEDQYEQARKELAEKEFVSGI